MQSETAATAAAAALDPSSTASTAVTTKRLHWSSSLSQSKLLSASSIVVRVCLQSTWSQLLCSALLVERRAAQAAEAARAGRFSASLSRHGSHRPCGALAAAHRHAPVGTEGEERRVTSGSALEAWLAGVMDSSRRQIGPLGDRNVSFFCVSSAATLSRRTTHRIGRRNTRRDSSSTAQSNRQVT